MTVLYIDLKCRWSQSQADENFHDDLTEHKHIIHIDIVQESIKNFKKVNKNQCRSLIGIFSFILFK